jgi:hypothetical protein
MLVELAADGTLTTELRFLPPSEVAAMVSVQGAGEPGAVVVAADEQNEGVKPVSDRVHIFYYNWYGAPVQQDGYIHWQQGGFTPPDDIGANYYPELGPYSCSDPAVLKQHMAWIHDAGVGVLSLTGWGRNSYEDRLAGAVLAAAAEAGLKVNFHLEPYEGRTPLSTVEDIRYILAEYGNHPAFYRAAELRNRPMFYIFRSLDDPAPQWKQAIAALRGTAQDTVLIAQTSDLDFIIQAGFDGGYSYDVLTPFKTQRMYLDWADDIVPRFRAAGKIFIPSVGPGYWDDRAMPNGASEPPAARTRNDGTGRTYRQGWEAAAESGAYFISITSFNEWHEGSQIEPAVAHVGPDGYAYPAYPDGPTQYLRQTAELVSWYVSQPNDAPLVPTSSAPGQAP